MKFAIEAEEACKRNQSTSLKKYWDRVRITYMPTFENQKKESLMMEAQRANDGGRKGR